MADVASIITEILQDVGIATDLYAKISANVAQAKAVLATNPDATLEQQLADAQAKLKAIQAQADQADAEFDAAYQATQTK